MVLFTIMYPFLQSCNNCLITSSRPVVVVLREKYLPSVAAFVTIWCTKGRYFFLLLRGLDLRQASSDPSLFYCKAILFWWMMYLDVFGLLLSWFFLSCRVMSVPGRDIVWMVEHWWCLSRCVSCPDCRHYATPIQSVMEVLELSFHVFQINFHIFVILTTKQPFIFFIVTI